MKTRNKIVHFCFVFLCSAFVWAQTPTPVPTVIVNDVVGFGSTAATEVWVNDDNVQNPIKLSDYIKGVLSGELGSPVFTSNSQRQNAYTAQAVAANSIWNQYYQQQLARITATPGATLTITPIPTDTTFQRFDDQYSLGDPTPIIENAVATASVSIITLNGNRLRSVEYSASTGASSGGSTLTIPTGIQSLNTNGNPTVLWPLAQSTPRWIPYLRISPNQEVPSSEIDPGNAPSLSPQVGLIQLGAFYLSEYENYSPQDILLHYYHTTPPYVLKVDVYNGATVVQTSGQTSPYLSFSGGQTIYEGFWAGALGQPRTFIKTVNNPIFSPADLEFQIAFSERVNANSISISLLSQAAPQGVPVTVVANPSVDTDSVISGLPPTTWFGKISQAQLDMLGSGPVTLLIQGYHEGIPQALLNSYPGLGAMYLNGHKDYISNTYFPGPDTNHIFQIGGTPTATPTPTVTSTPTPTLTLASTPTPTCSNGWCFAGPPPPAGSTAPTVLGYHDKLYLFPGNYFAAENNDVSLRSSSDGANWSVVTSFPNFYGPNSQNYGGTLANAEIDDVFLFQDKMWVFLDKSNTDGGFWWELWNSTDGSAWVNTAFNLNDDANTDFGQVAVNGFGFNVMLAGGSLQGGNRVLLFPNGANLAGSSTVAPWPARVGANLYPFNNQMFIMGGNVFNGSFNGGTPLTDIWATSNGTSWTQAATTMPGADVITSGQPLFTEPPVTYNNTE